MGKLEDVKYGWDFMAQMLGGDLAGHSAFSDYAENLAHNKSINMQNMHIQEINEAIDKLAQSINEHPHLNLNVEQFKGFVVEEWHAGTFNIDALRKGSDHRAWTLQDNGYGSVDVETNYGKEYSLKYSNTAKDAESMQAAFNVDNGVSKYQGQERLIAGEQVGAAKSWAHKRGLKDLDNRPDVSNAHMDTEEHIVGKITDGEGVESKELSVKESKQIAKEAKGDGFDPEKQGYVKDSLLEEVKINYVNQAMKTGLTAAVITAITQIVPELYRAVDYLIKQGEIDLNGLKKSGVKIISASGGAFLRGSIAYGVEMAIQKGMVGESLKGVNPSVVGVAVTMILGTIKDSILVAAGKMSASEMGMHFVDTLVVSSGYLVSMKIGGAVAQKLFPELPEDVLAEMGVHTIPVPRADISKTEVNYMAVDTQINRTEYETVNITVLRRGVIGVNKIGYVLA